MVEMAVVIAIGGLLLGYGLSVLTAQMTNTRITTTRDQENVIKTALITFLAANNRLPCPAVENLPDTNVNYGVEAATPGTCTGTTDLTGASRGIVPWISLGLADSAALDGWNRRFTYVVTTSHTNLGGLNTQAVGQRTVPGMRGNLTVHSATAIALGLPGTGNQINACSTTAGDNSCNNFAVVVIISHGADGSGAFLPGTGTRTLPLPAGTNEQANTDTDTAFTQMAFIANTAAPGGVYDDLLLWLPPVEFTMPLQASGIIPSAQGLLNDRVARIENALLSFAIADKIVDPDGPLNPPLCTCGFDCNGSVTVPAFWAGCRTVYHRVPYADKISVSNGVADIGTLFGNVPWVTLELTVQDELDPWGGRLFYQTFSGVSGQNGTYDDGIHSWPGADLNAYALTSDGPDATAATFDDFLILLKPTSNMLGVMAGARVPVD